MRLPPPYRPPSQVQEEEQEEEEEEREDEEQAKGESLLIEPKYAAKLYVHLSLAMFEIAYYHTSLLFPQHIV